MVSLAPRWAAKLRTSKKAAAIEVVEPAVERLSGHVLICGFTDVGEMAAKALEQFGVPYAVIDLDPEHIRDLRKRGVHCVFGDSTQATILAHAHVASAAAVLIAVLQPAPAEAIIRQVRKVNQRIPVLARALRQRDYQFFLDAGATIVVQPDMEAAATLVRDALSLLKQPDQKTESYVAALRKQPAHGSA